MASDTVYVVIAPIPDKTSANGVGGPRPVLYTTDIAVALQEFSVRSHRSDTIGTAVLTFAHGAPHSVCIADREILHQFAGRSVAEWMLIYSQGWGWDMVANVARVAMLSDEEAADLNTFDLSDDEEIQVGGAANHGIPPASMLYGK